MLSMSSFLDDSWRCFDVYKFLSASDTQIFDQIFDSDEYYVFYSSQNGRAADLLVVLYCMRSGLCGPHVF